MVGVYWPTDQFRFCSQRSSAYASPDHPYAVPANCQAHNAIKPRVSFSDYKPNLGKKLTTVYLRTVRSLRSDPIQNRPTIRLYGIDRLII